MYKAYRGFWKGYIDFNGKTGRKDFWLAMLCYCVVSAVVLGAVSAAGRTAAMIVSSIYIVATMIPVCAIMARRLNDAGKSRLHLLWLLLTAIGWMILTVQLCAPSAAGKAKAAPAAPAAARQPSAPRPAASPAAARSQAQSAKYDVTALQSYMQIADRYAHEENLFAENPVKKQLEAQLLAGGSTAQAAIVGYLTLCGSGKIAYGWWNGAAELTRMIRKLDSKTAEGCLNRLKLFGTNIWEYHTQVIDVADKELLELQKASGNYAPEGRIPAQYAHAELLNLQNLNPPAARLEKALSMQASVPSWSPADQAFYYFIAGGAARVLYPESDACLAFYAAQVFADPDRNSVGWDHLRRKEGSALTAAPETARAMHEKYPLPATMEEAASYGRREAGPPAAAPGPAAYTLDQGLSDLTALFRSYPQLDAAAIRAVGQRIHDANIPLVSGVGGMHQLYMRFKQQMPAYAPQLSRIWDGVGDWAD